MRHLLLFTLVLIATVPVFKAGAQQLLIMHDTAKNVKDNDTISVTKAEDDTTIKFVLKVNDTLNQKDIVIAVSEAAASTAVLNADYKATMGNITITKDKFWEHAFEITLMPNPGGLTTKFIQLSFAFDSFKSPCTKLRKMLVLQVKEVQTCKKYWFKDTSNTRKLELLQFTDFTGFSNDRPNGLLQQEFRFKWPLVTKWFGKKNGWRIQPLRSIVFPDMLFNRIDKSQKELEYSYPTNIPGANMPDSGQVKFTTMDILKYSNIHLAARLVVLSVQHKKFRFYAEVCGRVIRNKPYFENVKLNTQSDTSSGFRPIYSMAGSVEMFGKTLFDVKNGINIDMSIALTWLRMKDSYFKQFDAPTIDQLDKTTTIIPTSTAFKKVSPIYSVSTRLIKNWGEDNDKYIYLRIGYMYQTCKYATATQNTNNTGQITYKPNRELQRFHNHFFQLQLGVSLGLNEIFKSGEGKEEKSVEPNNIGA